MIAIFSRMQELIFNELLLKKQISFLFIKMVLPFLIRLELQNR